MKAEPQSRKKENHPVLQPEVKTGESGPEAPMDVVPAQRQAAEVARMVQGSARVVPLRQFAEMARNSPRVNQLRAVQKMVAPRVAESVVQRQVWYGSVRNTNFKNLWVEVGEILKSKGRSVYGRRQELKSLHEDSQIYRYADAQELVDKVYGKFDLVKLNARVRPDWDSFWAGISVPKGYHRRHILLSSLMRNAVYAVTDMNSGNGGLVTAYQKLCGSASSDVSELEATIVSALHNNKFNIFLGVGTWNSAIGGLANAAYLKESDVIRKIVEYYHKGELDEVDSQVEYFKKEMSTASVFGNERQRIKIARIYNGILDEAVNDLFAAEDYEPAEAACNYLISMLKSYYDSMAFDVSQSSDKDYCQLQNKYISGFHGRFYEIVDSGDLNRFESLFNEFMELEKIALTFKSKLGDKGWISAITQKK